MVSSAAAAAVVKNPRRMSRADSIVTTTKIHVMALDGIVNVNSLFTFALFLGLTWFPTPDSSAVSSAAENLIAFHVYSFSSFLFSSLVAFALKQTIKITEKDEDFGSVGPHGFWPGPLGDVNMVGLRVGTLVSGFGSVSGCGFLMMALVELVQIKLGALGSGSLYSFAAIVPLVTLVPLALLFYVSLVIYAFTR